MSEMERAAALLVKVPQSRLGDVIGYLQGLLADVAADQEDVPNATTIASMNEILEMVRTGGGEPFTGSTADLFAAILAEDD